MEISTFMYVLHGFLKMSSFSFRVMVLDNGQIKEFDSPSSLLNDSQSLFYNMAKDAGINVS